MLNRRNFLSSAASAISAALVPTWLVPAARPSHGIDLRPFCRNDRFGVEDPRYQMTVPFAQESEQGVSRYATDAKICIRVPINPGDLIDCDKKKLPPASSLDWTHSAPSPGRWRPWPKANYLMAANSECPRCHGTGDLAVISTECEHCGGTCHEWVGTGYDLSHPIQCRACKGIGAILIDPCPDCKGKSYGDFPSIQKLATCYVAADYHGRIARHLADVEYFEAAEIEEGQIVKIRFGGGVGLLMPLVTASTEEILRRCR